MADVFLSYARPDSKTAGQIARKLSEAGHSVWFDQHLPAHRPYADVISAELESARAVVVLWSEPSVVSQWVRSEANRARELGKLVQARLDDARLPMPFDQIQCADLRNWGGELSPGWASIVSSVKSLSDGTQDHPTVPIAPLRTSNRRELLIAGGAVAAVAAIGNAAWRAYQKPQISPEAQLALQKGLDALQNNDAFDTSSSASSAQAIAFLTDATRLAPDSAPAWGSLAMAYAVRKRASPPIERPGLDARSRSAAKRAMEIDSNEFRAIGALRMLEQVYRNWQAAEAGNREALRKQPTLPLLLFLMADVLASVGRCNEAADYSRKFDRKKWLIAGADRKVIVSLWSARDLAGADDAVRLAVERWPQHPLIWRTRLAYLTFSGRLGEAERVLRDTSERPAEVDLAFEETVSRTIDALAGRSDVERAVHSNLDYLRKNATSVFGAAHALAVLGARPELMSVLSGYFFGEGEWARIAPPAGDEDRQTSFLFQPPMEKVWADPQFARLLKRIGLEDYWRRSGTVPDFRRR